MTLCFSSTGGVQRHGVLRARTCAARGKRNGGVSVLGPSAGDEARDGDVRHGLVAAPPTGRIRHAARGRPRAVLLQP